jgi:hypothetical protein
MVATVAVEYWNGGTDGSPNKTSASTFRFRSDDSPATIDNTNPLIVPDSGLNYSYWSHIALAISGTFTEVSNIRFYSDGTINWTLGTDGVVNRGNRDSGDNGVAEADYEVATGTSGETGDAIDDGTNGHSYYNGQTTPVSDVTSDTSASPATIDSSTYSTSSSTKAVVLQTIIDTDATQGTQASETFTFLYDEI